MNDSIISYERPFNIKILQNVTKFKKIWFIRAQIKDLRDWLNQDQSVILFRDKFLVISAQQTLVVFGGSANKLKGYKAKKNQDASFKT